MWYNGITKFDLFNWIDESNIETNEKNDLKTRINTIVRGDGGLFEDLPDTYKINIGSKNGVSCLHVLNKRRYGEEKKKSIFDLMLKRLEWKERLLTQLKEFASKIKAVSIDESIKNTESYLAYRKLVRRKLERVFNVVSIICALMALALFGMVIADAIVSFDNDGIIYKIITPGTTMCGILDFIFGVCFANIERAEDDRERIFMLAIARDQKKSLRNTNKELEQRNKEYESHNNNLNKLVEELKTSNKKYDSKLKEQKVLVEELTKKNDELTDTINKAKGIGESYSLQQEKLEQKEVKLRICEQCHVPLEKVCNVCGHKNGMAYYDEADNAYVKRAKNNNGALCGDGWLAIRDDIDGTDDTAEYTIIFSKQKVILGKKLSDEITLRDRGVGGLDYVRKIVFNQHVKTIELESSRGTIENVFRNIELVAFAKPDDNKQRYQLGKNIFSGLYGVVEVKGLEYIANAEEGCFAGWDQEYCKLAGLNVEQKCFKKN